MARILQDRVAATPMGPKAQQLREQGCFTLSSSPSSGLMVSIEGSYLRHFLVCSGAGFVSNLRRGQW